MPKIIGVIGGASVVATNTLSQLIETALTKQGAFRDFHHPEMIIYQATQAPSRSLYLEGRGPSFINDYVEIAKKLKAAGAGIACMCCNTAHFALEEIQNESGLEFINLIREVVLKVKKSNALNVGLMATDGCLKGCVYEKYFSSLYPEARLIYPDTLHQQAVTQGICNTKNKARFLDSQHDDHPSQLFQKAYEHLIERGADIVITGCTDIRVGFQAPQTIDSLETLAECILEQHEK